MTPLYIARRAFIFLSFLYLSGMSTCVQAQIISSVAGNGVYGVFSGDGGPATAAGFYDPINVVVDAGGNLYITDWINNRIRKVNSAGIITTVAGNGYRPGGPGTGGFGGDGGPATAASLSTPTGAAVDAAGNIYIADYGNNRIRKVATSGIITTIAGIGTPGFSGDGGPALAAQLNYPTSVSLDPWGNMYIADWMNNRIRRIDPSGIITTVAGNGVAGHTGDGGLATAAETNYVRWVSADMLGNIYLSEEYTGYVRKVDATGIIRSITGTGINGFSGDGGPASIAQISAADGTCMDPSGNIYVVDNANNRIRRIDPTGIITTFAGIGPTGGTGTFSGDGGPATAAGLNDPINICSDAKGNIYFADVANSRIRKVKRNNPPYFKAGSSQTFAICENSTAYSLNTMLAVVDSDVAQNEVWSLITAPLHGFATVTYSTVSTGGLLTPAGASYTPTTGYSGTDFFQVRISDGFGYDTIDIHVTINPIPVITGPTFTCTGLTLTLSSSVAGGTWTSGTTAVATIGTGSGIVTAVAPGISVITYAPTTGCAATYTVSVNTGAPPITGVFGVCTGSTTSLTDAGGGTWSSSYPAVATVAPTGMVSGLTSGTTTITYKLSGGCLSTANIYVFVMPGAISGTTTLCNGTNITLSDIVTGGVWSSTNSSVATIGSATGAVTSKTAGTTTITYSTGGACYAATTMTVNTMPGAITGPTALCIGATTNLSDAVSGAVWSSSNTSVATVSTGGMVSALLAGTTTITYGFTTGCLVTASLNVTSAPTVITGAGSLCAGFTLVLSDGVSGGVWTDAGYTSTASVGSTTGIVTGIAAGTANITYSLGSGCTVATTVTVNAGPAAITGSGTVCPGLTIALTDATIGGTWSIDATTIATVSGGGVVSGLLPGTANIIYTISSSSCAASKTITVNPLPAAISGTLVVCVGTGSALSDASAGGTWSSGSPKATVGATSGVMTGVSTGTAGITYTLGTGCVTTSVVTVNPAPASITGITSVCEGSTITLSNASGGGTWSCSSPHASVGATTGVVSGISAGTATVSYALPAGCVITKNITVNPLPAVVTGASGLCVGSMLTLSGGGSGTWTTAAGGNVTVGLTTGIVTGKSPGSAVVTYSLATGCATTTIVTVDVAPTAVKGLNILCGSTAITLSDSVTGGTWSSAAYTGIVSVVPATGVITGLSGGVAIITYATGPGCMVTKTVTVNAAAKPITGVTDMCNSGGAHTVYNADAPTGTWTSTLVTVTPAGLLTAYATGTGYITYTLPTGCFTTASLTVNPVPGAISGSASACTGAAIILADTTAGGTWSTGDATVSVGLTTGLVTGMAVGTAVISYTLTTGCAVADTITVYPSPSAIVGVASVCAGATTNLSDALTGGAWSIATGGIATIGLGSGLVTGVAAGTAVVTYTTTGSCTAMQTVTVAPLPAIYSVTGGGSYCAGDTGVHVLLSGSGSGVRYDLYNGVTLTGAQRGAGTFIDFGKETGGGVYTVVATDTLTGCSDNMSGSATVVVSPLLTLAVTITAIPGTTVCAGTPVTFSTATVNGGSTPVFQWKVNSVISGTSNSSYSYTPVEGDVVVAMLTSNATCATPMEAYAFVTMSVVTPVAPDVHIVADPGTSIVKGNSVTFTANVVNSVPSLSYQWLLNAVPLPGATNASYTTSSLADTDKVSCMVMSNGVCVETATGAVQMNVNTMGVHSLTVKDKLSVLPNPNKGTFTIVGTVDPADATIVIELRDMLGQQVYANTVMAKAGHVNEQVQLGKQVVNGMYLLNVRSGSGVQVFHTVVER